MRAPNVVCFIDEAGDRGYLRNLRPEQDQNLCVLCARPIPAEHLDYARSQVRSAFDRFIGTAPEGAKHHITDAFRPGNEAWAEVARDVRREIFDLMLQRELRIVYAARRFKIAREMHELGEQMKPALDSSPPPTPRTYAVPRQ